MVDQAPTRSNGRHSGNGHEPSPRAVAHNLSELLHDSLTLGDLQLRLAWADLRKLIAELIYPGALLLIGGVLVLSCVPIALATIALTLVETTKLTLAQSFGLTLAGGLIVGGAVALAAVLWLRRGIYPFKRSLEECDANVKWLRKLLKENAAARRSDPAWTPEI